MLPANHAIAGLRNGSFMATRSQNGERPKFRVPFYGSTGNVCQFLVSALQQKLTFFFLLQRALEKVSSGK